MPTSRREVPSADDGVRATACSVASGWRPVEVDEIFGEDARNTKPRSIQGGDLRVKARFLYYPEKACVDHRRGTAAVRHKRGAFG